MEVRIAPTLATVIEDLDALLRSREMSRSCTPSMFHAMTHLKAARRIEESELRVHGEPRGVVHRGFR